MSAARAELDYRPPGRGVYDPGGLAGDGALIVHHRQQRRLGELGLREWRGHAQDWLVRKVGRPLRHRPHVAGEAEGSEVVEESRPDVRECDVALQPVDVVVAETERFEVGQRRIETCRDQAAAIAGKSPDEQLEGRGQLMMNRNLADGSLPISSLITRSVTM